MAQVLPPIASIFEARDYPSLLVGLAQPDDAAVYQLSESQAIISTVDFFTPIVDDPYAYGAIAAANALSDVYAMGGQPILALNLLAYPEGLIDAVTLREILRGGAEKVKESGAVLAGGHTVTDKEPKYGLAVTGIIHPQSILAKGGALVGDALVLTKPLGVGVITTALKRDLASHDHVARATESMMRLNALASRLAVHYRAHAMTDITGYGLVGHAHEMAYLGGVQFSFNEADVPFLDGAFYYAEQDIFPGGMGRNKDYFERFTTFEGIIPTWKQNLFFDPETSGGLLIALPHEQAIKLIENLQAHGQTAVIVGHVTGSGSGELFFR